jgi:hypothetical protein
MPYHRRRGVNHRAPVTVMSGVIDNRYRDEEADLAPCPEYVGLGVRQAVLLVQRQPAPGYEDQGDEREGAE